MALILATSDVPGNPPTFANYWALQSDAITNRWKVANQTGSLYTTAWQSLAVDNSPSDIDYVYCSNITDFPCAAGVIFPVSSIPDAQTLWRLRMKVKLVAPFSGSNVIDFFLITNTAVAYQRTHTIANTPTPGSWVTLDIIFDFTQGSIGAGGPDTRLMISLPANNPAGDDGTTPFTGEFRINSLSLAAIRYATPSEIQTNAALNFNYLMHDFNEHGKSID